MIPLAERAVFSQLQTKPDSDFYREGSPSHPRCGRRTRTESAAGSPLARRRMNMYVSGFADVTGC